MHRTSSGRALNRFVWVLAAATLFLICSGGMVTSKNVGLAVPDWPTTFGYNMFLFPASKWVGGIFFEHTHRLIASAVGFFTIVLAVWLWRAEERPWLRMLGWIALAAVVVQGVLGGLRVTMLKDEIGIFHACLAQAFFALLVFIGLATSPTWARSRGRAPAAVLWLPLLTTVLIYSQLALGATMRHQHRDLAILDFPLAYGKVIPDTRGETLAAVNQWREARALSTVTVGHIWLQMAHRFVALVIVGGVVAYAVVATRSKRPHHLRHLSLLWVVCVLVQVTLGAWTIWSNKAADVATAHVAVGATMLAIGVSICALIMRARGAERRTQVTAQLRPEEAHAL
jgi:cytochrome c oxidase assembly protein subunit 15